MADNLVLIHLTPDIHLCIDCGVPLEPERLVVTSAEATEHGWKIAGHGNLLSLSCPACGRAYRALQRQIPVHVSEIKCPNCDVSRALNYTVTKITLDKSTFSFEATLTCPHCNKRNAFKKALNKLADILSIEIGLT